MPLSANAACTSPTADAGTRNYSTADSEIQYCDGTAWKSFTANSIYQNLEHEDGGYARAYFDGTSCPTDATVIAAVNVGSADEVHLCLEYTLD